MMGDLYIVATPIGNLQDITLRAIETLRKVDFIACEDTRTTSILINHFFPNKKGLKDKLFSYYERVESKKIPQVLNLLKNGKNVALVSDSGTPTISDPGFKLVREAIKQGVKVIPIPGPSSAIAALIASGLPTDKFLFIGFLPKKPGHRINLLKKLRKSQELLLSTVIIFESPFRLLSTLEELKGEFGDINVALAKELTKIHEDLEQNKVSEFLKKYSNRVPKGEFVILFNLKS